MYFATTRSDLEYFTGNFPTPAIVARMKTLTVSRTVLAAVPAPLGTQTDAPSPAI